MGFARRGGPAVARSQRLRQREIRAVRQLVGECGDLSNDWEVCCARLLAGTMALTNAQGGALGGSRVIPGVGLMPIGPVLGMGFEGAAEGLFKEYVRVRRALHNPVLSRFAALGLPSATRSRAQLLDDRSWYRSEDFIDWFKPMGLDDGLFSMHAPVGTGMSLMMSLHRQHGSSAFESRHRQLARLIQQETAPILGNTLVAAGEPRLLVLPPRLRQVLLCLLEGDGEKQAAARLGLSRAAIHEYVGRLYRHFGVNDRAELLSLFLKRSGLLSRLQALLAAPEADDAGSAGDACTRAVTVSL